MINKLHEVPTFSLFNNYEIIRKLKYKINEIIDTINNAPAPSGSINYSTDEQEIGTWIDGKTLYQKSIVVNSALTSGENIIDIGDFSDIDTFVYGEGLASGNEEDYYFYKSFNDGGASGTRLAFEFDTDSGLICTVGNTIASYYSKYIFTIRYTKRLI